MTLERRIYLLCAGTVYNPYQQLQRQIDSASIAITNHFGIIDSALDEGRSVKKSVREGGDRIEKIMNRVIGTSRLMGFQHASNVSRKKMPALYGREAMQAAAERAAKVNKLMKRTTKMRLRATPDSDYVLSKERAIASARYEAAQSYFAGVKDGFQGSGYFKSWYTSAGEPCEDCQGNEDQGPIDVDDTFDSGDDYPSAHLNCSCGIVITRTA